MARTEDIAAETMKSRAERLALWQRLRMRRDAYVSTAQQHGASDEAAHAAAARHIRGDVRVFLDELLIHLREPHARAFLQAAPREWGVRTELLLDVDPLVPTYIAQSFPLPVWIGELDAAEREAAPLALAARDADWTPWLARRLERLGEAGRSAAEHVFGAAPAVDQGIGEGPGAVVEPPNNDLVTPTSGPGRALTIAAGVASVGAVMLGGIWLLRRI